MLEGSDCEIEYYDAVQSGRLVGLLTFLVLWRTGLPPSSEQN